MSTAHPIDHDWWVHEDVPGIGWVPSECELWDGPVNGAGYGVIKLGEREDGLPVVMFAHRYAYEQAYGPIPDGMTVDHFCFRPGCVSPAHLRLLSRSENARKQRSFYKTHCKHGHEFTDENTRRDSEGRRTCKTCDRKRNRVYKEQVALRPRVSCPRCYRQVRPENMPRHTSGPRCVILPRVGAV